MTMNAGLTILTCNSPGTYYIEGVVQSAGSGTGGSFVICKNTNTNYISQIMGLNYYFGGSSASVITNLVAGDQLYIIRLDGSVSLRGTSLIAIKLS
jgi:hypothetical protein